MKLNETAFPEPSAWEVLTHIAEWPGTAHRVHGHLHHCLRPLALRPGPAVHTLKPGPLLAFRLCWGTFTSKFILFLLLLHLQQSRDWGFPVSSLAFQ